MGFVTIFFVTISVFEFLNKIEFSLHWTTGPIWSSSRNVCPSVCDLYGERVGKDLLRFDFGQMLVVEEPSLGIEADSVKRLYWNLVSFFVSLSLSWLLSFTCLAELVCRAELAQNTAN